MGDALGLFKPVFALLQIARHHLQGFLGTLAISDVLDCTVEVGGAARLVFLHSTSTVQDAHFATGTNNAVFHVVARTAAKAPLRLSKNKIAIFRMDHLS